MGILYEFGSYGPIIMILISWYLLWDKKNLFFYYTIGIFANSILNLVLKGIIQEPRPLYDKDKVKLALTHAKQYFYQDGIPFNIFGMPSGHAQMAFFSTAFIYLSLKHTNLLYFYLFFSLLICYQRYHFNYHSISQLCIGAITGSSFGYFVYQLAKAKIKGRIREKPDDFGPI
jgi:membrane-associated phospholipid phosphatase